MGRLRFRRLSAGTNHNCGATPGGVAYCWDNRPGQIGKMIYLAVDRLRPTAVVTGLRFCWISAGDAHTCATSASTTAACAGARTDGDPR